MEKQFSTIYITRTQCLSCELDLAQMAAHDRQEVPIKSTRKQAKHASQKANVKTTIRTVSTSENDTES